MTNPTFGDTGMYENLVAGKALDLDGATVEPGHEVGEHDIDPDAYLTDRGRDSDGVSIGRADADADAAPN
jgi:hypothetical protein